MNTIKVIENAGSLSEDDLKLLTGTDTLMSMMRNRLLLMVKTSDSIDWLTLTLGINGFYHIRSIDQHRLYQVWFELAQDIDTFKKNLFTAKLSDSFVITDK